MITSYKLNAWYQFDSTEVDSWLSTASENDLKFYEFTQGLPFKVTDIASDGSVGSVERKSDGYHMDSDELDQWCILNSLDMNSLIEVKYTVNEQLHDLSVKAKIEIIEKLLSEIKDKL